MNLEKRIQRMKEQAESAVNNYYVAVEDSVKELGCPLTLYNNATTGIHIKLADDEIIKEHIFDQIMYDFENDTICVHQTHCDDIITDEWIPISSLRKNRDEIYQAILWLTTDDMVTVDGDTNQGTANLIWCFSCQKLYFIYDDGLIDCVDWQDEGIDYFINEDGEFAVHKYEWSDAIREIDEHEEELEEEGYS